MGETPTTPTPTSDAPTPTNTGPGGCVTMTPGKNGYVPPGACNAYYNFDVEFAPAVAVAAIFSIFTIAHVTIAFMTRKTYCWILIMGCSWEAISFVLHAFGAKDQQSFTLSVSHMLLYLLAPIWITGFAYMTFARQVLYWEPDQKIWVFPAKRLSLIFVTVDILTFLVQAGGGVLITPGNDAQTVQTGVNVYMTGLALQQAFIVFFCGLMVAYHLRMLRYDAESAGNDTYGSGVAQPAKRDWKPLHLAMYLVMAFITVRVMFRLAEFGAGIKPENPIPWNEEYSYSLDALPMMLCMLILALVHPGRYLVGPDSEFPTWAAKRRAKKAAKELEEQKQAQFGSGYATDSSRDRTWA